MQARFSPGLDRTLDRARVGDPPRADIASGDGLRPTRPVPMAGGTAAAIPPAAR